MDWSDQKEPGFGYSLWCRIAKALFCSFRGGNNAEDLNEKIKSIFEKKSAPNYALSDDEDRLSAQRPSELQITNPANNPKRKKPMFSQELKVVNEESDEDLRSSIVSETPLSKGEQQFKSPRQLLSPF